MSSSRIGTWGCQVILGDRVSDRAAGLTPPCRPTTRGAILLLLAVAVWLGTTAPQGTFGQDTIPPLQYDTEVRTEPRPLRLFRLTVDLESPELELQVLMADDPDGEGPAETTLTPPRELASGDRILAAVNTNAWTMVPPPEAGQRPRYVVGAAADVSGWVQTEQGQRSPPRQGNWSLWMRADGRAKIGNPTDPSVVDNARWAVSGFGVLLREGQIIPRPSEVRHPRTAAGLDESGRWLTLLVVDGRRTDYSEGVSERELAELMREFDCHDALNLDGGGSSILLYRDQEAADSLRVMNRPSDLWGPRPIPVMLGIARRK